MIKKLKVFAGDTRLKDVWVGASRWEIIKFRTARFLRKLFIVTSIIGATAGISYASFKAGGTLSPVTVFADKIVNVPIVQDQPFPPMLQKICDAESGGNQFLPNGNVVRGKVTPDDVGYCQIHESLWEDKARSLGYDIYTEQGNKDMALWIFDNYGTAPWNASKSIWSK